MDISKKQYWIFDLDGTLTLPVHDFPAIKKELGLKNEEDILGQLKVMPKEQSTPLYKKLDEMEVVLANKTQAAEGAVELLKLLFDRDCKLGVLTRNTHSNAWLSLRAMGVDHFFADNAVLGRDEARPKPNPDGVYKLLKGWGAVQTSAVMVGDYVYDLQAGQAADIHTIHVDSTEIFQWPNWMSLGVNSLEVIVDKLNFKTD